MNPCEGNKRWREQWERIQHQTRKRDKTGARVKMKWDEN